MCPTILFSSDLGPRGYHSIGKSDMVCGREEKVGVDHCVTRRLFATEGWWDVQMGVQYTIH
jgi:hypothetical protein